MKLHHQARESILNPSWGMSTAVALESLSKLQATEFVTKSILNVQQRTGLVWLPSRTWVLMYHHPKLVKFLSSFIAGASTEAGEGLLEDRTQLFAG